MLGPVLALGTSLTAGLSDFLNGTTSRRVGTIECMFCMQLVGALAAGGWVAASGASLPGGVALAASVGTGVALMVGLTALFQAMVLGTISIVAPISATGVVVPIVAGIVRGERPGVAQAVGIVAAIAGVMLATRSPREPATTAAASTHPRAGLGMAFLAALGVGVSMWLMAPASRNGVPWALFIVNAIPVVLLGTVLGIRRASLRQALERRTARTILASGLLSASATALYGLATRHGELTIVSVLASLAPALIVLLASHVLGERVHRAQQLGIAAVLTGVVLLDVGDEPPTTTPRSCWPGTRVTADYVRSAGV